MCTEGRLLVLLAQPGKLDRILGDDFTGLGGAAQWHAFAGEAHFALGKDRFIRVHVQALRDRFAQFHARGVDPGGGAVGTELTT